ncbi:deaminase domain-containing protein [Trichocoleus sp. DQ-U1]|uniref:deaminase domain-containing protein n=1 Tax=Trichocoleus sp. DQ-U1 TaxID=2933926 RepID=UPI003299BE46
MGNPSPQSSAVQLREPFKDMEDSDNAIQAGSLNRVNQIRQQLGVSRGKNIALSNFKIAGDSGELIAISGKSTRSGTVGLPQQPLFEIFEVPPGHSRAYDTEYKLLEELASRYAQTPDVEGTINLLTERPPCDSCSNVIQQFRRRFPNIMVTVNYMVSG